MSQCSRPPVKRHRSEESQGGRCAPGSQSRRTLFHGLGVGVDDFRCRAHVETRGVEEPNPTHSIVFVRRGVFARADRGRTLVADANQILFFNEAQPYRYTHPVAGGDDCTIVTLEPATALALAERFDPGAGEHPDTPFRVGHALSTPRIARLHLELLAGLRVAPRSLASEEVLTELIDESLRSAHARVGSRPVERHGPASRRRDMVESVKLVLNERFEDPPSLGELAVLANCSPFHLSRTFRRVTGLGLRHYLRRLRTRLAADRLSQQAGDLTRLALDLGFYDHSHFTRTFRREWGVPPSRLGGS